MKDSTSSLASKGKASSLVPQGDEDDSNLVREEDDTKDDSISDSLEVEITEDNVDDCKKKKTPKVEDVDIKHALATNVLCNKSISTMMKISHYLSRESKIDRKWN